MQVRPGLNGGGKPSRYAKHMGRNEGGKDGGQCVLTLSEVACARGSY